MSKKYYWLKLKDNFFMSKQIKKLRKVAGGDTYVIIYLKMQLLSIKQNGIIYYDGTEENIVEQLVLELDEDEDNIKMTLAFLEKNRLIEKMSTTCQPNVNHLPTACQPLVNQMATEDRLDRVGDCSGRQ
ncbi:phage replisome organizer N-terminal domain-containing protein [bacterium AH-315-E09]|nr:phage replisome organizer N-terminal domain-containing protein [bacterium AH-315-E09]